MSDEPEQNLGRWLVDHKQVKHPCNFIAGHPEAILLFCSFLTDLYNVSCYVCYWYTVCDVKATLMTIYMGMSVYLVVTDDAFGGV